MPHRDITEQLTSLLLVVGRNIREHLERTAKTCSFLQLKTLRFVDSRKTPSMKAVAHYFHITQPSATVIVNRLVETGHVKRLADSHDRRMIRLALTPKGTRALAEGSRQIHTHMKKLLKKLTKHEQIEFMHILNQLSS